jgi:hypothetical protein
MQIRRTLTCRRIADVHALAKTDAVSAVGTSSLQVSHFQPSDAATRCTSGAYWAGLCCKYVTTGVITGMPVVWFVFAHTPTKTPSARLETGAGMAL